MGTVLRQVLHRKLLVVALGCAVLLLVVVLAQRLGQPVEVAKQIAGSPFASSQAMPAGLAPAPGGMGGGGMARMAGARAGGSAPRGVVAGMGEGKGDAASSPSAPWPKSPMVIRNASLELRVENVPQVQREVARLARAAGGYVAEATLRSEDEPETAAITIRVPGYGLDDLLERIAALGTLLSKQLGAQEVTEEYVDLSSRKRNLEREEVRLLDLLNRAARVRDLLEVEQQVSRVRGEIEVISGRMRYLENRVALSTIRVHLTGPQPPVSRGGPVWAAADVSRQAFRSLRQTGRGLATLGIWLGVYLPIWLPLGLLLLWLARRAQPSPRRAEAPAAGPIDRGGA